MEEGEEIGAENSKTCKFSRVAPHIVTFQCIIGSPEVWSKDKCLSEDLNGKTHKAG